MHRRNLRSAFSMRILRPPFAIKKRTHTALVHQKPGENVYTCMNSSGSCSYPLPSDVIGYLELLERGMCLTDLGNGLVAHRLTWGAPHLFLFGYILTFFCMARYVIGPYSLTSYLLMMHNRMCASGLLYDMIFLHFRRSKVLEPAQLSTRSNVKSYEIHMTHLIAFHLLCTLACKWIHFAVSRKAECSAEVSDGWTRTRSELQLLAHIYLPKTNTNNVGVSSPTENGARFLQKSYKVNWISTSVLTCVLPFCTAFELDHIISFVWKAWRRGQSHPQRAKSILKALIQNVFLDYAVSRQNIQEFLLHHDCFVKTLTMFSNELTHDFVRKLISDLAFLEKYRKIEAFEKLFELHEIVRAQFPSVLPLSRHFYLLLLSGPACRIRTRLVEFKDEDLHEFVDSCWEELNRYVKLLLESYPEQVNRGFLDGAELCTLCQGGRFFSVARHQDYKRQVWLLLVEKLKRVFSLGGSRNWLLKISKNTEFLFNAFKAIEASSVEEAVLFAGDLIRVSESMERSKTPFLTPTFYRIVSNSPYRLLKIDFWWKCGCPYDVDEISSTSAHHKKRKSGIFSPSELYSVNWGDSWQCHSKTHSFEHHENPSIRGTCYYCGGYTCPCGRTFIEVTDIEECPTCKRPSPFYAGLSKIGGWFCTQCKCIVLSSQCSKCQNYNSKDLWRCSQCWSQHFRRQKFSRCCGECGEPAPGTTLQESRLIECFCCQTYHFPEILEEESAKRNHANKQVKSTKSTDDFPDSRNCCKKWIGANSKEVTENTVDYFVWQCGCGTQNPPHMLSCRECTSDGFTCSFCLTGQKTRKHPPTASAENPSDLKIPDVFPDRAMLHPCQNCYADHPRYIARHRPNLWWCAICSLVSSLHNKESQCPHVPRFLYTDSSWTCVNCGEWNNKHLPKNMKCVSEIDVCVRCNFRRPLGYSPMMQWTCQHCNAQRVRGPRCPRCWAPHPGVNVHIWKCSSCWLWNLSWRAKCLRCQIPRSSSKSETMRYVSWRCTSKGCSQDSPGERMGRCTRLSCKGIRPAETYQSTTETDTRTEVFVQYLNQVREYLTRTLGTSKSVLRSSKPLNSGYTLNSAVYPSMRLCQTLDKITEKLRPTQNSSACRTSSCVPEHKKMLGAKCNVMPVSLQNSCGTLLANPEHFAFTEITDKFCSKKMFVHDTREGSSLSRF